jgi:ubiquinone/menaquinone biosynthesis C-methylase UbiE
VGQEYTIEGGDADADRLARQAHVMQDATEAFLLRAGLASGARCLDLGCGQGQITIAMARVAGLDGRIVGADIDRAALADARLAARRQGVAVEFITADACEPIADGKFDLVFARLLLSHLVDPMVALRGMSTAVRSSGVVAVEDLLTGTLRSEPPRLALESLRDVYEATVRSHGGDPSIGPRLRAMFLATGLEAVSEHTVVNRMRSTYEKMFLAELIPNMRHAVLEAGAATEKEIDDIRLGVGEAAREPSTVFYQARMYQVSGRRPVSDES